MAETKSRMAAPFEVKESSRKKRRFEGLASVFGKIDHVGDSIAPGAYRKTIAEHERTGEPVYLMDQHRYGSIRDVLGMATRLEERKDGLHAEFKVVDSPDGDELLARLEEGMIRALSIGYMPGEHEIIERGGERVRLLKSLQLLEISAVVWPADPHALITPGLKVQEAAGRSVSDAGRLEAERILQAITAKVEADETRRERQLRELEREILRQEGVGRIRRDEMIRDLKLRGLGVTV